MIIVICDTSVLMYIRVLHINNFPQFISFVSYVNIDSDVGIIFYTLAYNGTSL